MGKGDKLIRGIVEDLIKKLLEDNIPDTECYGKDSRLFEIAYDDLQFFLMDRWKIDSQDNLEFRSKFLDCITEEGESIIPFLNVWVKNWYECWKKRVMIVFNTEQWNKNYQQVTRLMDKGESRLSAMEIREFSYPIALTLLEHGELACLRIMSENFIKLYMINISESPVKIKDKIELLNNIMHYAVDKISYSGPIIFIKLANIYFRNV